MWWWAARIVCLVHLISVHLALTRLWYGAGLRKSFTIVQNIHNKDLLRSIEIARAENRSHSRPEALASEHVLLPLPPAAGRLSILFMLRGRLNHADVWKAWLDPERSLPSPRVSLYFHLTDYAEPTDVATLLALPGARRVLPTVATGWCELMAAEVALYQVALADDPAAELFVLLPHDAVPLAPLGRTIATLMASDVSAAGGSTDARPRTRLCPAGVRGLDVPASCAHAIEPRWSRSLIFKHHQWMALSRAHAERVVNARTLEAAVALLEDRFLGEPLCSDEVLPLLALALPDSVTIPSTHRLSLEDLTLYSGGAARGLPAFQAGLRALGVSIECITYTPWPGCGDGPMQEDKRAKSPLAGGGLRPAERDRFMGELVASGILFARKLGVGGGGVAEHLGLIEAVAPEMIPSAPQRLFPQTAPKPILIDAVWLVGSRIWRKLLFSLATFEAWIPIRIQVATSVAAAVITSHLSVHIPHGVSGKALRWLLAAFVGVHIGVFLFSVVAFAEYGLLEPLRRSGAALSWEGHAGGGRRAAEL